MPAGSSVMRAAAEAGINIPKLCASDNLEAFGSCRLCLVQIEGRKGYPASCTTPVEEGMVIRSEEHTSELQSLMRISYAVFCLKKKNKKHTTMTRTSTNH